MNDYGVARILSRLSFIVVTTLVVATLYFAKVLLLPLAFAILFAFLLAPLVSGLERIRIPTSLAAAIVIASFAVLLAATGWLLFTQLVGIANDLPAYKENITQKISAIHSPSNSAFSHARGEFENLEDQLKIPDEAPSTAAGDGQTQDANRKKQLGSTSKRPMHVTEVPRTAGRLDQLGGLLGVATTVTLSVVLTFFVLLQRRDLRNRMTLLTGNHNLRLMTEALDDAGRRIARYFSLQLLVNSVYGGVIFVALYLIGLPHALLFAALAGACRFIPYVGWPIATMAPVILSLAVFQGWTKTLFIALLFLGIEMTVFNLAEPRIYGKHVGLSSLAILIAASFWTLIWGPIGLVLSMPLTVCLVVMGRHFPSLDFLTVMLGDRPDIPLSSCFYQRLLAHDELEAGEILANSLKNSPLEAVYDSVLIPALIMSEDDRIYRDLDELAVQFIRETTGNLIDEFGYKEAPPSDSNEFPRAGEGIHAVCVPVSDETDELAARMFAQILNRGGVHTHVTTARRLSETLATVSSTELDVIFLCELPPFALARQQRLIQSLRARNPHARIVLSLLSYQDGMAEDARSIAEKENVRIVTKLGMAMEEVRRVMTQNQPQLDSDKELVGTRVDMDVA